MKQLKFLETKRTPRYSMRKLNVGMASVLLGVTIFGINLTNHSVKAATTVENSSRSQQTSAGEVQQNGARDRKSVVEGKSIDKRDETARRGKTEQWTCL